MAKLVMKAGVGHASYNTCMILGVHKAQKFRKILLTLVMA